MEMAIVAMVRFIVAPPHSPPPPPIYVADLVRPMTVIGGCQYRKIRPVGLLTIFQHVSTYCLEGVAFNKKDCVLVQ
jgi:hypothetical protein